MLLLHRGCISPSTHRQTHEASAALRKNSEGKTTKYDRTIIAHPRTLDRLIGLIYRELTLSAALSRAIFVYPDSGDNPYEEVETIQLFGDRI